MTKDENSKIVDQKLDSLRKLSSLVDVAKEIQNQFPDDDDIDRDIEEYFGELEIQRKKYIIHKRRDTK